MNSNARKTGLFLMELIIAILFFSLASAICIQLFVRSHTISERSIALNHSILLAQNTAELFYADDGAIKESTLFYTDTFDSAKTASDAAYEQRITLTEGPDPSLIICHITILELSSGDIIYSLDTTLFQKAGTCTAAAKE